MSGEPAKKLTIMVCASVRIHFIFCWISWLCYFLPTLIDQAILLDVSPARKSHRRITNLDRGMMVAAEYAYVILDQNQLEIQKGIYRSCLTQHTT